MESHGEVGGYSCAGARRRTASTMMRAQKVIGSDAGSNYHIRAAKHRVLGTLLGQPTLRITYGGRVEGRGGGRNKGVRGHGGGPPAP